MELLVLDEEETAATAAATATTADVNNAMPSLRRTVLSLTVALTSSCTSWRDAPVGGGSGGGNNENWIPRLVRGTRVIVGMEEGKVVDAVRTLR